MPENVFGLCIRSQAALHDWAKGKGLPGESLGGKIRQGWLKKRAGKLHELMVGFCPIAPAKAKGKSQKWMSLLLFLYGPLCSLCCQSKLTESEVMGWVGRMAVLSPSSFCLITPSPTCLPPLIFSVQGRLVYRLLYTRKAEGQRTRTACCMHADA